ncbi:CDP-diacylglycerol--glycerol-3-phosphate 3-phosphatidyltransferase [Orenia marismortui]|uniref:CDP-diacylglycerol--glycerol-3-phosphate 3-phosphatidyltransferase n=1 Tax=Orenia marismortui TaxID=46469 RepID=A0A4R8GYJ2_9FIRM|nr:CDP-diacylglycerol--glycerol-3-phosphate 3-phosphatidyltransferase [Orenia marismortui]TDX51551.1 cardiolipin synthase [Orenia marismortui]
MNTANVLTLSRIILLPIFMVFFFSNSSNGLIIAGIIFAVSALTDLLDGYIARKYNQVSQLGRLLDPLADKLTMISVFISLSIKDLIPLEIILIILIRETIILFGSFLVYFNKADIISPSKFGKTATFLLYITAAAYILNLSFGKYIIFIAIPLTVISGVHYCIEAFVFFLKEQDI